MSEQKYKVMRTRKLYPLPSVWNGASQTSPEQEEIHGKRVEQYWMRFENGIDYSGIYSVEEWNRVGEFLSKKLEDRDYIEDIYRKQKEVGKEIVKFAEKILEEEIDDEQLLPLAREIKNIWIEFDRLNVPPWFIGGDKFELKVRRILEEEGLDEEEISVLTTCSTPSFSMEEEKDILKICKKIEESDTKGKLPGWLDKEIRGLVDDYYWIPFGYDGPKTYDRKHYLDTIKEYLKKDVEERLAELDNYEDKVKEQKSEVMEKHSLNKEILEFLETLEMLTKMTDERKACHFRLNAAFNKVIERTADNLGMTREEIKLLTLEEIEDYTPGEIKQVAKRRARSKVYFHYKDGELEIKGKESFPDIEKEISSEGKSVIKGRVASKSGEDNIKGKVKIAYTPDEIDKVTEEDILVTHMTTPEFVPAMRRCRAIVTDEGGVTCHAAIVSRELGKPCIIGTQNATNTLKDGDIIEVDADNGVVRKL